MNTLIAVGTTAAYGYSSPPSPSRPSSWPLVSGVDDPMPLYFDTAAAIITLILLGPVPRGAGARAHLGLHPRV